MKFWTNWDNQYIGSVGDRKNYEWDGKRQSQRVTEGLEGEEEWMKEDRVRGREGEIEEGRER